MVDRTDLRLVYSERDILALVDTLSSAPWLGVDTEFHAEHRYRPELMLVQLASPDGAVWVLDPRASDLRPLGALLERTTVVVHGGAQDVELLHRATGVFPRDIFDTQRAAAMLGMGYPARLGVLVQGALGQRLDKGAGLTDWSLRPLSVRQLQYAAEDARILLPLATELRTRLGACGRLEWAASASGELVEELSQPPDLDIWMGWDIASALDEDERRALHALFQWREETGRSMDQPPRQMLSDSLALDIARRRPLTLGELTENRRIPQGLVKRHGAAITTVLRRLLEEPGPAPTPPRPDVLLRAQVIELWASARERSTGLARSLLLPRALSLKVAAEGASALRGWRALAVGRDLSDLLEGRAALTLDRHAGVQVYPMLSSEVDQAEKT